MKILYLLPIAAFALGAEFSVMDKTSGSPPPPPATAAIEPLIEGNYIVAAPGRVEPGSEEIAVGVPLTGRLDRVLVKAGDQVKQGQVVAQLDTKPYEAMLQKAAAELRLREAELLRLQNGARPEERDAAHAALEESESVLRTASADLERRRNLLQQGTVSQEEFERVQGEYDVARQRCDAAKQHFALVNGSARTEDIQIAQAEVEVAQADRDKAQSDLDQSIIRSPIDGTVLRVFRHAGEVVSIFVDTPVVMLGDLSQVYVRADVDENDVAKVKAGMPAFVTAEAFGEERFAGHVTWIGRTLGKKNIYTDEPKERDDAKVLEVLVRLDDGQKLPTGLRVNTFMMDPGVTVPGIGLQDQAASPIAAKE
jgi:HlyD family secretion protein